MPRALLSVSNKTGLEPFAQSLLDAGYDLISTGGTFRALQAAGLDVQQVADVTRSPEILGGRVKTLHPKIHGGILAKRSAEHAQELEAQGIVPIDLVAVNLYPFQKTVAQEVDTDTALENIDIGGPTMLRSAAKNFPHVVVVSDPADYERVARALREGVSDDLRLELARKAFAHTAAYDAAIVSWFDRGEVLPETLHVALERVETLRYGENPHQRGARYKEVGREEIEQRGWWDRAEQHSGVALSYLNLFDAEAAWRLVHEFDTPAAVIVKHANPCGVALAQTIEKAYEDAFACDPKSAFGGVVALNRTVSDDLADMILDNPKADVLIAPSFTSATLARFAAKRKNMRVLSAPPPNPAAAEYRRVDGGFLVQEPDEVQITRASWRVVTQKEPTEAQWRDLEMAWTVCAYTKSNAIVLVQAGRAVGVGAGQQSRVDAAELAAQKAAGRAQGGASASDAFYPFRDGIEAAAAAGVAAVIQPGGSVRDEEMIEVANELELAMVLTGVRHFRH